MPDLLLLHGICSSGAVFGPSVGPGLKKLLEPDFRVMVAELTVGRPSIGEQPRDFDSHLHLDLPEIWESACTHFGEKPFVLGYSMGGMLALAGQGLGLIDCPKMMIVAAPFRFNKISFYPPLMKVVLKVASKLGLKRIPIRIFSRLIFWFFALQDSGITKSLRVFHILARRAGVDISAETLAQAVLWVQNGKFCDASGEKSYLPFLKTVNVPVLFLAGDRDRVAPPDSVKTGFESIGSPIKKIAIVPKAGHLDFVAGSALHTTANYAKNWFLT